GAREGVRGRGRGPARRGAWGALGRGPQKRHAGGGRVRRGRAAPVYRHRPRRRQGGARRQPSARGNGAAFFLYHYGGPPGKERGTQPQGGVLSLRSMSTGGPRSRPG